MVVLEGNYRHSGREPGAETGAGMGASTWFRPISILRSVDVATNQDGSSEICHDISWLRHRNFRRIWPKFSPSFPMEKSHAVERRGPGVHHSGLHGLWKDHTGAAVHPGLAGDGVATVAPSHLDGENFMEHLIFQWMTGGN